MTAKPQAARLPHLSELPQGRDAVARRRGVNWWPSNTNISEAEANNRARAPPPGPQSLPPIKNRVANDKWPATPVHNRAVNSLCPRPPKANALSQYHRASQRCRYEHP